MQFAGSADVVVIGGGAAGLAAATTAEAAGLSCQLLEAQDRLGGRIRTVPLRSGGVFDEGAQMINGDMLGVLDLARRAGLHLSPIPQTGIGLCIAGHEILRTEDLISVDEIYALLEDEVVRWDSVGEALRAVRLKLKWLTTPWESFGEAGRAMRLAIEPRTVPRDSLAAALRALLLSPEEHAMAVSLFSEVFGAAPAAVNAHAARDLISRYASERDDLEFQVRGGSSKVIDRLASDLCHTPRLGTAVRRVRAARDKVEVTTGAEVWTADHVVVAVPPPVARRIVFDLDGSEVLDGLLASFTAGDLIKTVLVFETAFWRLKGLSGSITFADPTGLAVVDASLDQGLPPCLVAFQGGPLAREWAALSRHDRQARLLRHLSRAFGQEMPAPREVAEAVWVDHPWSGGGYNATVRTGGDPDAVARLAAWDGPVRFAGAEVDDRFWGYVEGAIHSGRRAIARIIGDAALAAAPARRPGRTRGACAGVS